MDEGRKKLLKKVPTRTLIASIKKDLRKAIKASSPKPATKK
jgi:hypothetical protein